MPRGPIRRPSPRSTRRWRAFNAGGAVGELPYPGWNTAERLRFLNALPRELPAARLAELDAAFRLSQSGNSETLFAWLQLALANRYQPAVPAAERFLAAMGRRKFVDPLFKTLMKEGEWGRPIAQPPLCPAAPHLPCGHHRHRRQDPERRLSRRFDDPPSLPSGRGRRCGKHGRSH